MERSQQTDLQEFYGTVNLNDPNLNDRFVEWQFHYNYFRPHSSLNGKTPIEVACEHSAKAPFWDEVEKHVTQRRKEFVNRLIGVTRN